MNIAKPKISSLFLRFVATLFFAAACGSSALASSFTWSTLAGTAGSSGNTDATGAAARFNVPNRVAVDSSGNVYVADRNNHVIRRITASGVVTTFAGSGTAGGADGQGAAASFSSPRGIAVDAAGFVYVADTGNYTIRKISPSGLVSTLAGTAGTRGEYNEDNDGTGPSAKFTTPEDVTVDGSGNVYVSDVDASLVRKITPAGVVTTFAGTIGESETVDGTGTAAKFVIPAGLGIDSSGNVYVTDEGDSVIRKISPAGVVTTLAGSPSGDFGSDDGPGTSATFRWPADIASDAAGNLYVADTSNHTIRRITPAGVVSTLAGTAGVPGSADVAPTSFNRPFGIAVDALGNLYVADTDNHTIRKATFVDRVRPTVAVTTPKKSPHTTKAKRFTLRGTATDNVSPTKVEFRIKAPNKKSYGSWRPVNLGGSAATKNWSYNVALSLKGNWTVEVRSRDRANNTSTTRRVTIRRQ